MKNTFKLYLTLWVMLFTFLNVNAQCETIMKFFKDDMYTSKEFVAFAEKNPQKAFDSWKILYNEKTGLAKNIEDLNLVSKNLDEINRAGGYLKWKNLKEINQDVKLLGESKITHIQGLSVTENSIVYVEGNKIINEVIALSKKKQPGAGSVLVKDSKFSSAVSNKEGLPKGTLPESLHPVVKNWFENPNINAETLTDRLTHGKCAEPEAISRWLYDYEQKTKIAVTTIDDARDALKGTKSIAFETTTKFSNSENKSKIITAEIGDVKIACDSCNPFLGYFGVQEIKVNINIKID